MDSSIRPIAIVQGAESAAIQQLLGDFAARHAGRARIVGVLEDACSADGRACGPGMLRSIADGRAYRLFQDLGAGASSCALDPGGVVEAGEAVRSGIAQGCDLVVLSKFGKLEAENGSGLIPAFAAAIEAGVPVLTSVSPRYAAAWSAFAEPLFLPLPADAEAIEGWWQGVRGKT